MPAVILIAEDASVHCRCGCPELAHTGAYGIATACTGPCGCSYYEPNLPETEKVTSQPGDQGYNLPLGAMHPGWWQHLVGAGVDGGAP